MALSLSRPKHKSLTIPSFCHLFSSSFYRPNGQFSEQISNNSQPQQLHKDSASSSFSSSSSNDISNKPVSGVLNFDSLRECLESLSPWRSENSENVNNNRGDTTPELYRRNMMAKSENVGATNESSSSSRNDISNKPVSRVLEFDSIRESLESLRPRRSENSENVNNNRRDTTPMSSFMSSLRLKPANENHVAKSTVVGRTTELPENVFGKELNKDKRSADVSTSSEFFKTYTYAELGKKFLRPKVKGKDEVSPVELNERFRELRKIFEEEKTAATNPGFLGIPNADLRKSLIEVDKKNDEQEQEQKRANQSLAVSDQLGTTPEFMLPPPKESLVEKEMSFDPMESDLGDYFHTNPVVKEESITAIDPTNAWTNWRIELARKMFSEWRTSRENEN